MAKAHQEVETKYDVDGVAALPPLDDLPDVSRVDGPRTFELEAHYFDTEDLALGRRGITLRRRTGGDDDGWHLKLPVPGARQEIQAPLGRVAQTPPLALRRAVQGVVRDLKVGHIATIRTERTVASLRDEDDSLLAEICDDRVLATRVGLNGDEVHAWREWEIELHDAQPSLTEALGKRMRRAGAEVASGPAKLGRVMQLDTVGSSEDRSVLDAKASEHELLTRHVTDLVDDLHRLDPAVRADLPDAVHQMRLTIRRLRSALRSFDVCFDTAVTDPVRDELGWIGDVLGGPRDIEVLQSHLGTLVLTLPRSYVRGRPGRWIESQLRARRRAAFKEAMVAMASDRYFSLVDSLDSWQGGLPWSNRPDRRATKSLPKVPRQDWRKVEKAVQRVDSASEGERPQLLHQVRKRARRVRYAAEALEPVLGSEARQTAKTAKKLQRSLGAHHDAVVAVDHVLHLADVAHEEGRDTFTLGILIGRLEAEQLQHDQAFRRTWKKVR